MGCDGMRWVPTKALALEVAMPINGKPKDTSLKGCCHTARASNVQQQGLAPNPEHCGFFAEIGGEECALVRSGGRLELESCAAYGQLTDWRLPGLNIAWQGLQGANVAASDQQGPAVLASF